MPSKEIFIYNSLSKKKERLTPLEKDHVRMYACGITPYAASHIGHAMQAIFFDIIRKYLEDVGYKVTYVRNFTDVDDKIIQRAQELKISPIKLAQQIIDQSDKETLALGILAPTFEPKVSLTIPEIISMVETLISKKMAYATADGDVYFRVKEKKDYGKLSRQSTEDMRSGTRDITRGQKEDELDFALWKHEKLEDASWQSPWGRGRPGWHIECSAMAKKYLGDSFDIHGGGRDLIFPHHENEIAQSESSNDHCYASIWMHSGLLTINQQKMSKSLGNSITIEEFLKQWPGEVLRLGFLQNHYRSNVDFSQDVFKLCLRRLLYYYQTLAQLDNYLIAMKTSEKTIKNKEVVQGIEAFHKAMSDDFNTAEAIGELNKLFKLANKLATLKRDQETLNTINFIASALRNLGGSLRLFQEDPRIFIESLKTQYLTSIGMSSEDIEEKIQARNEARQRKEWAKSDLIRDELLEKGILLQDTVEGTQWMATA